MVFHDALAALVRAIGMMALIAAAMVIMAAAGALLASLPRDLATVLIVSLLMIGAGIVAMAAVDG